MIYPITNTCAMPNNKTQNQGMIRYKKTLYGSILKKTVVMSKAPGLANI